MRYSVAGRHITVGPELRRHAEQHLKAAVEKFELRPTEASATLSRNASGFACEVAVHLSSGISVQSKGSSTDVFSAVSESCGKAEKQLRRYKRRLRNHHRDRVSPVEFEEAQSFVLESAKDAPEDQEPESLEPIIIAEMETRIPTLSVGEAVLQLELADSPVLVFRNDDHGGVNVVYRREDGNIGWISPGLQRQRLKSTAAIRCLKGSRHGLAHAPN